VKNLPKLKYMQILALEIAMSKPRFDRVEEETEENRITHDRLICKNNAFY
jgi:hypothetical protein